jgi:uncharacterized protein (TIGR03382 family)
MSYVVAGYAIALSVLALYSLALLVRRRRLERAAARRIPHADGLLGGPSDPTAGGASDPTAGGAMDPIAHETVGTIEPRPTRPFGP